MDFALAACTHSPAGAPMSQKGKMLFCLGNVTDLLDVTPSNPMPHPLPSQTTHSTSCYLRSKIWLLSNIQQSLLLVQLAACNLKNKWVSSSRFYIPLEVENWINYFVCSVNCSRLHWHFKQVSKRFQFNCVNAP